MATPNPQLRYATNTFDANGTTTDWEVNFVGGYIDPAYVHAYSVVVDAKTGLESGRVDHSTSIVSSSADAATVRVSPAVAAGRRLYIYRSTLVAKMLVDYVNGSLVSKNNLNLSNEQLLDLIQEIMDGVNLSNSTAESAVGAIINIRDLIDEVYNTVLAMLQSGGIISVAPRVWSGTWSGDTSGDTEFDLVGADITDSGFYDVYVNGVGQQPGVDFTVMVPADNSIVPYIRFTSAPVDGSVWFVILRGYAKPFQDTVVTQTDIRIGMHNAVGPVFYADQSVEFGMVRCTYLAGTQVTINTIPEVGTGLLSTGSYFSIVQKQGPVTVVPSTGVNLNLPVGCIAATRGVGSVITAVCEDAGTNTWLLAGDLAKEA